MESLSNLIFGVIAGAAFPVRWAELVAGPFPSFRITTFYAILSTVVASIGALLGLVKIARDLRTDTPATDGSDDQGADDVNPDTHRQDPGSRHPTWKRALWYGFVGLLIFIALGAAAHAAFEDRTKYEVHVVIESGQIIVPAGMGGPTRQTLDSRDFKAYQPEQLVTDRDPNKGAGVWLVTWLAAEYAAN